MDKEVELLSQEDLFPPPLSPFLDSVHDAVGSILRIREARMSACSPKWSGTDDAQEHCIWSSVQPNFSAQKNQILSKVENIKTLLGPNAG